MTHGSVPGKVIDVSHPNGLFLAKVRALGLWDAIPDIDIPWAEFLLPLGARPDSGRHIPVEVDDLVWIDFPRSGDTRYPRITGSCYFAPSHDSHLPTDGSYAKCHENEPPAPKLSLLDDVEERFGIQRYLTHTGAWGVVHMSTGSRIEISDSGIIVHSETNSYRGSNGDTTEDVGGSLKLSIVGKADIEANEISLKSKGKVKIEAAGGFECKAPNWQFNN